MSPKLPTAAARILELAEEHGWETYTEHDPGSPLDSEELVLYLERYVPVAETREVICWLKWERPPRKRWRSVSKEMSVRVTNEEGDIDDSADDSRTFKALSHIEHWIARPAEVLSWDWVLGARASGSSCE